MLELEGAATVIQGIQKTTQWPAALQRAGLAAAKTLKTRTGTRGCPQPLMAPLE